MDWLDELLELIASALPYVLGVVGVIVIIAILDGVGQDARREHPDDRKP